jgi:hypothetical protein
MEGFSLDGDHNGCYTLNEYNIELTPGPAVWTQQRPLAPDDQQVIESEVKRLLENGLIEPSYSKYNTPISVVYKENKPRMICDARRINARTIEEKKEIRKILQQVKQTNTQ